MSKYKFSRFFPSKTYVVGIGGLEPPTSRLSGVRSNRAELYAHINIKDYFHSLSKLNSMSFLFLLRKEVIQPHLPIRLPCYDFTLVIDFTFGSYTDFGCLQLPWCDGRCVQDPGTHSPRHSDPRLLATPTSYR